MTKREVAGRKGYYYSGIATPYFSRACKFAGGSSQGLFMPSPKPTPTKLKLLRGNPGQRKSNEKEPQLAAEIPPAPPHLTDPEAIVEWQRLTQLLYEVGVLARVDANALALYCDAHAVYIEAKKDIAENGFNAVTGTGSIIQRPSVGVFHRCRTDMLRILTEFGMTPSSRTKVSVLESKENELEKFLELESG